MRRTSDPKQQNDVSHGSTSPWWFVAAFIAGVAFTIPVMLLVGDGDPVTTPEASPTTTSAEVASTAPFEAQTTTTLSDTDPGDPAVEPTNLDSSETSIGVLRWTRISGDLESVPAGPIKLAPDGGYLAIEAQRTWRSGDGLTWRNEPTTGFGDVQDVWIEGDWAIAWDSSSGTSGDLEMGRLFERTDDGWAEVDLPPPSVPDIDGIVWSAAVSMPVEQSGVTVVPVSAHGEIPWGDHYGVSEYPCGARQCEGGPFGHIERGDLWTLSRHQAASRLRRSQ